jgi:methylenetetrahydrofolate reductase (NADPH)
MKITELFNKNEFVVSCEVGPSKGAIPRDLSVVPHCVLEARHLLGFVHGVNVTDNQSAVMRLGSLAACIRLKQVGFEPIYQLTCRDRNRLALQSDILTAYSMGIDNMLLLTGDHIKLGDHKTAKPVFDLDSVQLIKIANGLRNGYDEVGNKLSNSPDMAIGAVVTPNFEPMELQIMKMEKKIEAGAEFFQTQAVYDPIMFEEFIKKAENLGRSIQLGMVLVKSAEMAEFMNKHIAGIQVPQSWIKEMKSVAKEDRKKKCVEMTARVIRKMKPMVQGIHIMPLGWADIVPDILDQAGIKPVQAASI